MGDLSDVLRQARAAAGMTQMELADAMGIAHPTVSQRETGIRQPPPSQLAAFVKATGTSLLLTPGGWNVVDQATADQMDLLLKAFGTTDNPLMQELTRRIKMGLPVYPQRDQELDPAQDDAFSLPLLGQAAAGPGSWNDEAELSTVSVASRWLTRLDGAILVHGDSMEPLLRDGDLVGVRLHEDYEVGDVVVAVAGAGECIIKVFGGLVNGLVLLNSANLAHPPVIGPPDELDIQGVAYGLLRAERLRVRR